MQKLLNRVINTLKWPVAIAFLLMLPGSVVAVFDLLGRFLSFPSGTTPFILGLFAYGFGWWLFFRRRIWGSSLSTLEHELTHALFALLTFHRVKSIKTTWRSGGAMQFEGGGNWLITIAPYFVPTLSLFVLIVQCLVDPGGSELASIGLGATVSYHVTSTWRETHREQTDLKETGFLFAWLFLPTANLLGHGFILSFVLGGWSGGCDFLWSAWADGMSLGGALLALF